MDTLPMFRTKPLPIQEFRSAEGHTLEWNQKLERWVFISPNGMMKDCGRSVSTVMDRNNISMVDRDALLTELWTS